MNVVVDAGGLIATERGSSSLAVIRRSDPAARFLVPTCVLAQVWRDGRRQANLSRFIKGCELVGVAPDAGQRLGKLLGAADTCDVVDATVVDVARDRGARLIVTSDPDDLKRLIQAADVSVKLITV